MIFVIVPCLCNDVSRMSGVIYAIFSCYVMKHEVCQE